MNKENKNTLKGLSHAMDLALRTCMVSPRPELGKRPIFKFFRCSNDFITQKVHFSRLMRVFVGLIMFAEVYLVQVSLLLIGQQSLVDFFLLAEGLCKFYANTGGKRPIQRQPFSAIQASSQSTVINEQLYSTCD
jgi:hypothetical protein